MEDFTEVKRALDGPSLRMALDDAPASSCRIVNVEEVCVKNAYGFFLNGVIYKEKRQQLMNLYSL